MQQQVDTDDSKKLELKCKQYYEAVLQQGVFKRLT